MSKPKQIPDHTAVRVALWRALHVLVDSPPHVLTDTLGLNLANPDENWQQRPDMHPQGTRGYRASIVGRARLIEDLVLEQARKGLTQYVILGAGLDTFAQRRPPGADQLRVFEIDMPATQEWKKQRLTGMGYRLSDNLRFVPVDFEAGDSWEQKLLSEGFDPKQPALFSSTGVSMYLTKDANRETLRRITRFAKGSTLALAFMLPLDLIDPSERPQHEMVYERARAAGTPFISFFRPEEMLSLARAVGFREAKHVSRDEIIFRYFKDRPDGLVPSTGEEFLVAVV